MKTEQARHCSRRARLAWLQRHPHTPLRFPRFDLGWSGLWNGGRGRTEPWLARAWEGAVMEASNPQTPNVERGHLPPIAKRQWSIGTLQASRAAHVIPSPTLAPHSLPIDVSRTSQPTRNHPRFNRWTTTRTTSTDPPWPPTMYGARGSPPPQLTDNWMLQHVKWQCQGPSSTKTLGQPALVLPASSSH